MTLLTKGEPLIRICHVSNAIDYDTRDTIYPVHYLETHPLMTLYTDLPVKLQFRGIRKSILYTAADQILYMESTGNHTLIHMDTEIFECTERLSSIVKRTKDRLLRCHASYLVNPLYVQFVERFSLTLSNGKKSPSR